MFFGVATELRRKNANKIVLISGARRFVSDLRRYCVISARQIENAASAETRPLLKATS